MQSATAVRPTFRQQPPVPVKGMSVHPNMLDKLRAAGLSRCAVLIDARPLLQAGAQEQLAGRGFEVESQEDGRVIMGLGHPQLYRAGQRAVLKDDGAAELYTFADVWVQIIRVDAEGRVEHNSIQKIPH